MIKSTEIVVIGAGQAGLALGYFLKHKFSDFVILDKEDRIGDSWRNRYDSLELFTPRWFSALPGKELEGAPEGFPTKDEMADYLENYAKTFALPVQLGVEVQNLKKHGPQFSINTNRGVYLASKVIIATGPFQEAHIPALSKHLSPDIYQVHTSVYKNPRQLNPGSVLVVGAGNSGAQIAVEISRSRKVFLSTGHRLKFFPYEFLGKSIFWWFRKIGLYKISKESKIGRWLKNQGDPIFGKQLKRLIHRRQVILKPRAIKANDHEVHFEDASQLVVQNIIWATGFYLDYNWIKIPGVIGEDGVPRHKRGLSPERGLYFLGLPWQDNRSSALIGGVGADAAFLIEKILAEEETLQDKRSQAVGAVPIPDDDEANCI